MIPPTGFVSQLKQYDDKLRIRWGVRTKHWIIERQMPPRHRQLLLERPNPYTSARSQDIYDGWRDGYLHVLSVHPTMLDQRVFQHLADADAWRQGGFEAVSRAMDRDQEAWEQTTDKQIQDWTVDASKEAHDRLQWLLGNRVALTMIPDEDLPIESVEQHDGFRVRTRRVGG
jgi:hypothetical protein